MANIVLTRIDDRLIHGQVMAVWLKYLQANKIIIVDDTVAQDSFMQNLFKMIAPPGVKVEVYSVSEALDILKKEDDQSERVIVLAKTPKTVYSLIEGGVDIKKVDVGGIGAAPGRKSLYRNISVSEEEKQIFKEIMEKGIEVVIQIVPDDREVRMDKLI